MSDKQKNYITVEMLLEKKSKEEWKSDILNVLSQKEAYGNNHYSAGQLANYLRIHPRFIGQIMHLCFGETFTTVINGVRIEEAKTVLRNPKFRKTAITEISEMVGFQNVQPFISLFTKLNSVPPTKYRTMALNGELDEPQTSDDNTKDEEEMQDFQYRVTRFKDIEIIRYPLHGFAALSLRQKKYIYCLAKAALYGRDITFDQNGRYNLRIRRTLELIYENGKTLLKDQESDFLALTDYLRRVWFSSGIHHHYGAEKFVPDFSEAYFRNAVDRIESSRLPLMGRTKDEFKDEICKVIFDENTERQRVNQTIGEDLIKTSANNFYENVTQEEVLAFYNDLKAKEDKQKPRSLGLNSKLVKVNGRISEHTYRIGGLYTKALERIVFWLDKAKVFAENDEQREVIGLLIEYYKTGDLHTFNQYCIRWVSQKEGDVDFINGFIEVYGDALGLKGTWEGLVEYKDLEGTKRTDRISRNAQWFEDNSPIDPRFKKKRVKGVSAKSINAAMLAGDEYPATAIGINLPNADWIRKHYGSKSITISNITASYDEVAKTNGMREEFVQDTETRKLLEQYSNITDTLHTDLHECLGHGSGQMLEGVSAEDLKSYHSTIEEARADLFALYFLADKKMIDLGLLPDREAYKAEYYSYMLNGLMTQLVRIEPKKQIEEAHMRNRALIARWCLVNGRSDNAVELFNEQGKTCLRINDYEALRRLFKMLLQEVQRIKSEGDYAAAKHLVEKYGVKVDEALHEEMLSRYKRLSLTPYKGFLNPHLIIEKDDNGNITDIKPDYSETYEEQMMRYSQEYGTLI